MSRSKLLAIAGTISALTVLVAPNLASAAGRKIEIVKPATVCVTSQGPRKCYSPPANDPPFNINPKASLVTIATGRQLVLFTAIASAGGSGSQMSLALLEETNGGLSDRFPFQFSLKEDSSYQFLREPAASNALVFVTAEFIWGNNECHFCAHKFTISSYVLDAEVGRYSLRDKYVTAAKYTAPSSALVAETPQIHSRLQRMHH